MPNLIAMPKLSPYVKVRLKKLRKTIYLTDVKIVQRTIAGIACSLINGYECDKECEPVLARTPEGLAERWHFIQISPEIGVTPMRASLKYGSLEDYPVGEAANFWSYPETR